MPTLVEAPSLTLEAFHAQYDGEKPYYEYWNGEAVQKTMPTLIHSLIQKILCFLLDAMGYESSAEIKLKLAQAYEPIPDVIAWERGSMQGPYPTKPFDVVIEILSPEDAFSRVLRKCRLYEKWGIRRVIVIDPVERLVWHFEGGVPRETDVVALRRDRALMAEQVWADLDRRLEPSE